MSISTLESPATRRALSAWHAEQDRQGQAEAHIRDEITRGFTLLSNRPASTIAVPALVRAGSRFTEGTDTVAAVVADRMAEGRCMAELLQVLEHSSCAHVQQLRDALAKSWADSWASDIAPHRAGL